MGSSLNKTGIIKSNEFSDFAQNIYDRTIYIEPDNSTWMRIAHHNNPAAALFSSGNSFDTRVYLDSNRWFMVSLCDQIKSGKWELMVKQKTTSDAAETKWRWIQSTNPMAGSYNDVKAANVTKNSSSGYSVSDVAGGIYKFNSNTYLVIANASNGNWYGAIGAWNAYNGGIPGYPNTTVTTGYMDLYLRVDSIIASIGNIFVKGNEIIEI